MTPSIVSFRWQLYLVLGISLFWSIGLIAGRLYAANSILFGFIAWNLLLAFIPFAISSLLFELHQRDKYPFLLLFGGSIWLLFFPNTLYLLTDLFHLSPKKNIPYWYDLLLLVSAAWNGLLLAIISLQDMQHLVRRYSNRLMAWFFVLSVALLSGFGVYLGRYLRWNSWDIVLKPQALLYDIAHRLLYPTQHPRTYGVTLFFSAFLLVTYYCFRQLSLQRNHRVDQ